MKPLSVFLSGEDVPIVGHVWIGAFYKCRNGDIVGPMIDDGADPSFGYIAAMGCPKDEIWYSEGWCSTGNRDRDLVEGIEPPLTWTSTYWRSERS